MGFDEEMMMLNATKFGTLTMGELDDITFSTLNCSEQILSYIKSQICFKQLVREKNYEKIKEMMDKLSVSGKLWITNSQKVLIT
jgi:hypothetical protein